MKPQHTILITYIMKVSKTKNNVESVYLSLMNLKRLSTLIVQIKKLDIYSILNAFTNGLIKSYAAQYVTLITKLNLKI